MSVFRKSFFSQPVFKKKSMNFSFLHRSYHQKKVFDCICYHKDKHYTYGSAISYHFLEMITLLDFMLLALVRPEYII